MPFTPFHFGPAAAVKAAIPKRFSFLIFCSTQVFVDLESGYYLLRHEYPVHRFLHTFLGATVAGLASGLIGMGLFRLAAVFAPALRMTWGRAFASAFIGSISHILLDSIMHRDMRPFAPFSDANPFLGLLRLPALHGLCILVGILGAIAWLCLRFRRGLPDLSFRGSG